ncbi:hypothetical protein [Jeotgalibacillus malaysiensis]|uniref:hypothetical protein n=1 Tax=Jeotgalibacillus malaysiensis TaxID=1508404 RepID=UPI00384F5835
MGYFDFDEDDQIIEALDVGELKQLVYNESFNAARKANEQLFKGMIKYIDRLQEDILTLLNQVDYLKLAQQGEMPKEVKEEKGFQLNQIADENNLTSLYESLDDGLKTTISDAFKKAAGSKQL